MDRSVDVWRAELPRIERACVRRAAGVEFTTFVVACVGGRDPRPAEERAAAPDSAGPGDSLRLARAGYLRRSLGRFLCRRWTDRRIAFDAPDVVFRVEPSSGRVDLEIAPVFFAGRYRKLARGLPQSRWVCRTCGGRGCGACDGAGRRYSESVEERIADPVRAGLRAEHAILHAMGREDIDARMLGSGRPFVLEVRSPRSRRLTGAEAADLCRQVASESGGRVEITDLRAVPRAAIARFKEAASSKTYSARVRVEGSLPIDWKSRIASLAGVEIAQDTPRRVRHRRAAVRRLRRVLAIDAKRAGSTEREAGGASSDLLVSVHADAGLYVKELISGDEGRTLPSIAGLLGVPCRCAELDVVAVAAPDDCRSWLGEDGIIAFGDSESARSPQPRPLGLDPNRSS